MASDEKTKNKYEIVCAYIELVENHAEAGDIILHSKDDKEAAALLRSRFGWTERAANACLEFRFRRMSGKYREKLYAERDELMAQLDEFSR